MQHAPLIFIACNVERGDDGNVKQIKNNPDRGMMFHEFISAIISRSP